MSRPHMSRIDRQVETRGKSYRWTKWYSGLAKRNGYDRLWFVKPVTGTRG